MEAVDSYEQSDARTQDLSVISENESALEPIQHLPDYEPTRSSQEYLPQVRENSVAGSVGGLSDFVVNLEFRLNMLESGRGTALDRARETLFVLRQLLLREVGLPTVEEGAPTLFRKLGEPGPLTELFVQLYRDARSVLSGRPRNDLFANPHRTAQELESILTWYLRRKNSLWELDRDSYGDDSRDRLFNVRIFHDRSWAGFKGCELLTGLWLVSRAEQRLWLKAFVRADGDYVHINEGWQHWVDDTDSFIVSRDHSKARFAALLPVFPRGQRQLIDSASVFIPYAALALPPGAHTVEFELLLCNDVGTVIAETSRFEQMAIPQRKEPASDSNKNGNGRGQKLLADAPSPQSLGLWQKEVADNSAITEIALTQGLREIGGVSQDVLIVNLDAEICGHADHPVTIELRILRRDGTSVASQSRGFASHFGEFLHSLTVHPRRAVSRIQGLEVQLPLRALSLESGKHDLFLEVSLLSREKRIICGTLAPFNYEVDAAQGNFSEETAVIAQTVSRDPLTAVTVSGLHVGSGINPAAESARSVRAQLDLRSPDWRDQVVRVVFSLETSEGHELRRVGDRELLRKIVAVGGGTLEEEVRNVIVHFDEREVLPAWADVLLKSAGSGTNAAPVRESSPLLNDSKPAPRLVLRAKVFSLADELLGEIWRASLPASSGAISSPAPAATNGVSVNGAARAVRTEAGNSDQSAEATRFAFGRVGPEVPLVVDIQLRSDPFAKLLECGISLNLPSAVDRAVRGTLYFELLSAEGETLLLSAPGSAAASLPGLMRQFDHRALLPALSAAGAPFQLVERFAIDVSGILAKLAGPVATGTQSDATRNKPVAHPQLKCMLFSAEGRLMQSVKRPFDAAQLLRRPEDGGNLLSQPRNSSGTDNGTSAARGSIGGKVSKFLFGAP